mmetsp:Transcript_28325/g.60812  ORF Transcript_28325/g.60812 Transcript_28325/m.60812 type:complete len:455 (+) Transcript_28325:302-1666(+)
MADSPPKSIALAIAPKITSFLSICGSSTIIFKIMRNQKSRRDTLPRIMLGMSICDVLVATWFFASTWPIPKGTISSFGDGITQTVFGAIGTDLSCNIAGFFNQYQVASPLFNATLATYYLLVVYYGWTDRRIKRVEWLFYTIPISFGLITATFAVAANLIGPVAWTCAILPPEVFIEGAELTPIQSHYQLIRWIVLFGPVWICIVYVSIIFIRLYKKMRALELKMGSYKPRINRANQGTPVNGDGLINANGQKGESVAMEKSDDQGDQNRSLHESQSSGLYEDEIYYTAQEELDGGGDVSSEEVRDDASINDVNDNTDEEKGAEEHNARNVGRRKPVRNARTVFIKKVRKLKLNGSRSSISKYIAAEKSRVIAVQGLLYVLAFYVTWFFPTISRFLDFAGEKNYAIQFLDTLLLPLQGFFNCFVYLRPSIQRYRRRNPTANICAALGAVITNHD